MSKTIAVKKGQILVNRVSGYQGVSPLSRCGHGDLEYWQVLSWDKEKGQGEIQLLACVFSWEKKNPYEPTDDTHIPCLYAKPGKPLGLKVSISASPLSFAPIAPSLGKTPDGCLPYVYCLMSHHTDSVHGLPVVA